MLQKSDYVLCVGDIWPLLKNPPSPEIWKRFISKIEIDELDCRKCWIWTGKVASRRYNRNYGSTTWNDRIIATHRLMMLWLHGPLPQFLVVDHVVCNNPPCCNPLHVVPHTQKFNTTRPGSRAASRKNLLKTHCKNGHPFDGDNLLIQLRPNGNLQRRNCRICYKAHMDDIVMRRKANPELQLTTIRIFPSTKKALVGLKKQTGKPLNVLVQEAIQQYKAKDSAETES